MNDKKKDDKIVSDGFTNLLKGLGSSKDARTYNQYSRGIRTTQSLANDLYTYNWICGKAVDVPVGDAIQNWRSLLIEDPEKKKDVEESMKSFTVKDKVEQALKWARVFGGAAIIPIIDGENLSTPLNTSKISKDSLKNLVVLDRYRLNATDVNRDILSNNFGKPNFYTINESGQSIHHSRVIRFDGDKPTIYEMEIENYWGLSLFTRLWEPVSDSQTVSQSISNLIFESNIDVYMIKGFNELMAEGSDDLVKARLEIAHKMKSIINGIALDGDDTYDKKTNNFANLSEIDDRFMYKVAGAVPMPITRLIGREPAGLNATGQSDERIYNKSLLSIQDNQIRPALDQLDPIITASTFGQVETFNYVFNPIQLASPAEQAEIDLKRGQLDAIYLAEDIVDPVDVKAQLAENGTYVTITPERVKREAEESDLLFTEEEESEDNG